MKRTALAMAGISLTQCLVMAVVAGVPLETLAQPRPNVEEAMRPVAGRKNYAQDLVDRTVARHPELLEMEIHATAPGAAESQIVAAKSVSRVGKRTDPDDAAVFKSGEPRVEINQKGDNNVEVAVQLRDVTRRPVGVVEFTFRYASGTDQEALIKKAEDLRDQLARRISSGAEDLVTPAQYDPRTPVDTYAQSLVDDALASQPGILIAVLHVKDPKSGDYPIVASSIGRIGKEADASDLEVIRSGATKVTPNADGSRIEAKVAMRDASGEVIGAAVFVFPTSLADRDALGRQGEKVRDDLSRRTPSLAALYGPYPAAAQAHAVQTDYDKQELGNQQSLPMTKAVTSGDKLEQASQEGYSEAIKGVAGVAPTNSKGTPNDAIAIRGIKLNLFSNYRLNGGLPTAGVITTPTENKERIETLKGANALMFGVASPAGIVNLVTKRAGNIDVTTFSAAGNSFGQYGGSVDIGRRFGPERQLGLRVNASGVHLENGIHGTGGNGHFVSTGMDFKVTDRLTIQGDYEYYMKQVIEQAGVSLAAVTNGRVPITPVPNPRNLLTGTWNLYPPHTWNQQIRADYQITDGWKLLAETGRSDANRTRYTVRIGGYDLVTGANGTVNVQYAGQHYKNSFSRIESLAKLSTWMITHDLTVGASETERDAISDFQVTTVLPQKQNIFDPIVLLPPVLTVRPTNTLQASFDKGVYAYDTIGVTSKLKVLLGIRRTKDDETTATRQSSTITKSPAYGALYDVIPSLTLFASYMEGLEAGGTAPATAVNSNEILPSAISKQKEVGVRDSHVKGLSLNASYFKITRANAVTDPVTRIFGNSGEIEYTGFETTLSYEFLRSWRFSAAGQWLKAKQVTVDPTFNGFTPENTPKALGNASIAFRPPWVPGLALNAGVSGVTNRFVNNQEQGTIPGYALYNAGAGYVTRIHGKRVAFQVNVDNLANKRYWNSVQTGTYGIGMDRSFKFNARVEL